jgi:hypothetical protein
MVEEDFHYGLYKAQLVSPLQLNALKHCNLIAAYQQRIAIAADLGAFALGDLKPAVALPRELVLQLFLGKHPGLLNQLDVISPG